MWADHNCPESCVVILDRQLVFLHKLSSIRLKLTTTNVIAKCDNLITTEATKVPLIVKVKGEMLGFHIPFNSKNHTYKNHRNRAVWPHL